VNHDESAIAIDNFSSFSEEGNTFGRVDDDESVDSIG
jgi:hypothetical protein